jgi:hypothetical protein
MRLLNLSRRTRLLTVAMALFAFMFTQAAIAGFACHSAAEAADMAGMPCAETMADGMDEAGPALCHAHCQSSQASADQLPAAQLASVMQLGAVLSVAIPVVTNPSEHSVQPPLLRVASSPPLAITHCRLRT